MYSNNNHCPSTYMYSENWCIISLMEAFSHKFQVFGKLMENVRHRRRINLVSDDGQLRKFTAQPTFKCAKTFHANLVALERYKPTVVLNKPIYIGLCVLDLSKVNIYLYT